MLKAMGAGWFRERTKKPGSAGRFYRKSLIMIFVVAGVPGLIIGGLLYGMAGGRVKSELLQLHYRQIEQRSHNIDDQLGNLELLLSHWAFDSKFDTNLIETNFVQNYEKTNDITKTLLVMEGSNSMVKKVELYLGGERRVLFNPEYTVLDNQTASAVYEPLIRTKQVTYWSQKAFDAEGKGKRDLILVHQIPGGTFQPFGVLLLRFDGAKVASLLSTLTPYNDGETFLSQDSGDLFVSSSASASNSPLVMELKKKVGTLPASKGSFFYNWKGTTYTVSYGKLSRISEEWTLVSASPITQITAPVVFLSKLIVAVSLCALLLAALLAWLASRQIYSPVNRLVQVLFAGKPPASREREDEFALIESHWHNLNRESRELNTRLAEQLPHVKEGFLHQLLQGYLYAYSEEDLRKRMERFKWPVEGRKFIVLYLQLTGITSMGGKFRYGDEGLVTFAAVNMIDELAAEHFGESNTINFHDLTAGVLLMVPGEEPHAEKVHRFGQELMQGINQILTMRVTLAISPAVTQVTDIPLAFERVKHAVSHRNFENENQLIDLTEEVTEGSPAEVVYPFALERELVQALRTGRQPEAEELLQAFLGALTCKGAKEIDVQQGMLQLLGSIQHAILVSGIHPNRLFGGANRYEQLSQIREPELIMTWFREKVITPFLEEMGGRTDAQVKRYIEEAMIYLQNHYQNDISLDNCADHIGTNPFFLSKSFKQVTGKNFIDYLTELRMEKAKELLRESEMKISEVAEQVGYQHSYFNRIFKKLEGMTPTRYRELSRHS